MQKALFAASSPKAAPPGSKSDIASVAEIFALQGDAGVRELEKTYLR